LVSKDGYNGVRAEPFKLRAKLAQCKICIIFNILCRSLKSFAAVSPHAKFAIRLFLEWRFAQTLCGAQDLSSRIFN
jgi:hypothetical protein